MKSAKVRIIASFPLLLAVVFFAGCTGKSQTGEKSAAPKSKAKSTKTGGVSAPEEKVEKEVYVYDAKGRRDPFKSLAEAAKEKPHRKKANPMENYDVDEIKLTAIVWDNNHYYGLITLPDNKSYTITKGMTLGLYGGKVQDITKDGVLIREQVKDYRGRLRTKDTLLKLRKGEEE